MHNDWLDSSPAAQSDIGECINHFHPKSSEFMSFLKESKSITSPQ
jgi:hypothetical protein